MIGSFVQFGGSQCIDTVEKSHCDMQEEQMVLRAAQYKL